MAVYSTKINTNSVDGGYFTFSYTTEKYSDGYTKVYWNLQSWGRTSSPTMYYAGVTLTASQSTGSLYSGSLPSYSKSYSETSFYSSDVSSYGGYNKVNKSGNFVTKNTAAGAAKITISLSAQIRNGSSTTNATGSGTISISGNPHTYTITFDNNGGSGGPGTQTKIGGVELTISSTKPTRTGYTFVNWKTTRSDGTVYYFKAGTGTTNYNGDQTLVAQWDENYLTVNYYSNYATEAFANALNTVGEDKNVLVRTAKFYYDNAYSDGLHNWSSSSSGTYLARIGYKSTGNWQNSDKSIVVSQATSFDTGQALAEKFGKSLKTGNASISLYPQWKAYTKWGTTTIPKIYWGTTRIKRVYWGTTRVH